MRLAQVFVAAAFCVLVATVSMLMGGGYAAASENQINQPAPPNDGGTGIRVFGPIRPQDANLTMQCPNTDVYVRAGCDGGRCIVDAGLGDVYVSFIASNDSYPFPLDVNSGQNQVLFQNVDGGAATCYFYRVQP